MTEGEYKMAVAMMSTLWPSFKAPVPGAARNIWLQVLSDVTPEELSSTLAVMIERGQKFAPGLAEIRATVNELRRPAAPLWGDVWKEILDHVHNAPDVEPIQGTQYPAERPWSAPVVGKLVEMVGWETIGRCYDEDLGVLEAQCRGKYEAMVKRELEDQVLARVPGELPRLQEARARSGFVPIGESLRIGS